MAYRTPVNIGPGAPYRGPLGQTRPPYVPPAPQRPEQRKPLSEGQPQRPPYTPPAPQRPAAKEAVRPSYAAPTEKPGKPAKLPAPVLGWYTASSVAEAPPGTAIVLENWFCEPDALRVRKGFQPHTYGQGSGTVESLLVHTDGTSTKLFSVANGYLCDVTAPGTVPTADVTGLTNSRFQYTNIAVPGGAFLVMCNGADDVIRYDGTTWTTASGITGVDPATLVNTFQYKERLWFIEADTTDAWYLPANSITGAANKLACGALLARGGRLIAGINWSVSDAGDGKDDVLAILSSEGEMLIFTGTDPAVATAWDYLGNYYVGKPLGYRCLYKAGGDVLILSEGGVLPLSKAVTLDQAVFAVNSLSKQFQPNYTAAVDRYGSNFGWQMVSLPTASMAILNVPVSEGAEAEQFVWNTATGAPSKFTGIDAVCWALFDGEIYFGAAQGRTYKAETGANDNGADINAYALPAYTDLESPATLKHIKLVRALFESSLVIAPEIAIAVDYMDPDDFDAADLTAYGTAFTWDVTPWDAYPWGGTAVYRPWISGNAIGSAISPATRVTITGGGDADDLQYRLFAWHLVYEDGGIVG